MHHKHILLREQESLRIDNRPGRILRDWLEAPVLQLSPPPSLSEACYSLIGP